MASGKERAEKIALQRIEELYLFAQEDLDKHPEDSRTAIRHMRQLATKHNIQMLEKKKTYCLNCNTLLVPGKTCTVRTDRQRRVLTCGHCGQIKKIANERR